MQITIDLPQDIEQDLIRQAAQSNVPLQTLVLQALRQLVKPPTDPIAQRDYLDVLGTPVHEHEEKSYRAVRAKHSAKNLSIQAKI